MTSATPSRRAMIGAATGVVVVFQLLISASALLGGPIALPGCPDRCGDISVPYPFGVGDGCFYEGFNLTCDGTHRPPKLIIGNGVQVLDISLPDGTVHIQSSVLQLSSAKFNGSWSVPSSSTGIFKVSAARNSFVAFGCNMAAHLVPKRAHDELDVDYASICAAMCTTSVWEGEVGVSSCSGVACCRTSIARGDPSYDIQVKQLTEQGTVYPSHSTAAFIVDQDWFISNEIEMAGNYNNHSNLSNRTIPAVLEWSLDLVRDEDLLF